MTIRCVTEIGSVGTPNGCGFRPKSMIEFFGRSRHAAEIGVVGRDLRVVNLNLRRTLLRRIGAGGRLLVYVFFDLGHRLLLLM